MANVQKYTKQQLGQMFKHYDRSDPDRKYGNQEIKKELTYLNYNLAPDHNGLSDFEFTIKRCEELKVFKRKDVNYMADWIVTEPGDYKGDSKDFFKATYDFLESKYGKENIISAYVHMDETTPHMHFAFVPVYHDSEKNIDKVNAKKLLNIDHLQNFHTELQQYLDEHLENHCTVVNEETMKMKNIKNKSIEDLKKETIKDINLSLKRQEQKEKELDEKMEDVSFWQRLAKVVFKRLLKVLEKDIDSEEAQELEKELIKEAEETKKVSSADINIQQVSSGDTEEDEL